MIGGTEDVELGAGSVVSMVVLGASSVGTGVKAAEGVSTGVMSEVLRRTVSETVEEMNHWMSVAEEEIMSSSSCCVALGWIDIRELLPSPSPEVDIRLVHSLDDT